MVVGEKTPTLAVTVASVGRRRLHGGDSRAQALSEEHGAVEAGRRGEDAEFVAAIAGGDVDFAR